MSQSDVPSTPVAATNPNDSRTAYSDATPPQPHVQSDTGNLSKTTPISIKPTRLNISGESETHKLTDGLVIEHTSKVMFKNLIRLEEVKLPDPAIGFNPTEVLKSLKNGPDALYDDETKKWTGWPSNTELSEQNSGERLVAEVFNKIGTAVAKHKRYDGAPRKWSAAFCNYPVPHDRCKRQPDCVLMAAKDADAKDEVVRTKGWKDIFVLVEVKGGKMGDAVPQLAHSARLLFGAQPDRNFVLAVLVVRDTVSLVVINRAGLFLSDFVKIHKHPERFVRIVAGLMFADRQCLGFDETIVYTPFGNVGGSKRYIMVNDDRYDIVEVLHTESVIRGRGTVCFKVKKGDQFYVIKNGWVDKSRKVQEPGILKQLHECNIPNVTKIKDSQTSTVTTRDEYDTCVEREYVKKKPLNVDNRMQLRAVLEPFGKSILEFSSLAELLHAFINIVEALEAMHKEQYLHRDISIRNILLNEGKRTEGERDGLLIDFDYAINLLTHFYKAMCERTGTLPFMAIELLSATDTIHHEYYHDLESLFYVLCFICCVCSGPNGQARANFDIYQSALGDWFGVGAKNTATIGKLKERSMLNGFESVLKTFDGYFAPLKDHVRRLRRIVLPPSADTLEDARLSGKKPEKLELTKIEMKERDPGIYFKAYKDILQTAYNAVSQAENAQRASASDVPASSNEAGTPAVNISTIMQGHEELPLRPRDVVPDALVDVSEGLEGIAEEPEDTAEEEPGDIAEEEPEDIAEEPEDDNEVKEEVYPDVPAPPPSPLARFSSVTAAGSLGSGQLKRKAASMEEPFASRVSIGGSNSQRILPIAPAILKRFSNSHSSRANDRDIDEILNDPFADATEPGSSQSFTKKLKRT